MFLCVQGSALFDETSSDTLVVDVDGPIEPLNPGIYFSCSELVYTLSTLFSNFL